MRALTWQLASAGFAVGLLIGLTGVGGGSLLTPALVWAGISPALAVGTDLLFGTATRLVGTMQHLRQRSVEWRWALPLAIGGTPAAVIGSYLTLWLHLPAAFLRHALGAVLVLAAAAAVVTEWLRRGGHLRRRGGTPPFWRAVLIGAAVGLLVGLTSIGAGTLAMLALLIGSNLDTRQLVGTDLAQEVFISAAAGLAHFAQGTLYAPLALNLLVGGVPGVWLGSRLGARVPARPLKVALSSLILLAGLRLVVVR